MISGILITDEKRLPAVMSFNEAVTLANDFRESEQETPNTAWDYRCVPSSDDMVINYHRDNNLILIDGWFIAIFDEFDLFLGLL